MLTHDRANTKRKDLDRTASSSGPVPAGMYGIFSDPRVMPVTPWRNSLALAAALIRSFPHASCCHSSECRRHCDSWRGVDSVGVASVPDARRGGAAQRGAGRGAPKRNNNPTLIAGTSAGAAAGASAGARLASPMNEPNLTGGRSAPHKAKQMTASLTLPPAAPPEGVGV